MFLTFRMLSKKKHAAICDISPVLMAMARPFTDDIVKAPSNEQMPM